MKIVVLGGTGYTGQAVVAEAAGQAIEVVSVSRTLPADQLAGVAYIQGSVQEASVRKQALEGADVVVASLSPRGDMAGQVAGLYRTIASEAATNSARLFVIGGFGSLRPADGAPRFVDGDQFPADYRAEALELASVLDHLQSEAPAELDWLYVSPAASFGAHTPGSKTGRYTITSGQIAAFDANGESKLSSQDLALALVNEATQPRHHRQQISVAY